MSLNEGVLSFQVWPTYAGAIKADGTEPISHRDYQRGQIFWETSAHGIILGRTKILVPKGIWTHILYAYHPSQPQTTAIQKLVHPFDMYDSGDITLEGITFDDVQNVPILRG